ncbi:MAG: hypothetical protein JWP88_1362 [Flaviaesturariibacter sp.]|nr:hypothetical protein [Flaviaesturariibacter sp.]
MLLQENPIMGVGKHSVNGLTQAYKKLFYSKVSTRSRTSYSFWAEWSSSSVRYLFTIGFSE